MRPVVALDLDQTTIFSRPSFRLPSGAAEPPLRCVERLDGADMSFVTVAAAVLLRRLAAAALLVPTTTRTLAQLQRVDLGVPARYAVAANGGHLLVAGVPDPAWQQQVRCQLAAGAPLPAVLHRAQALADPAWCRTVRVADGLFVYLVAHDRTALPVERLRGLADDLAEQGWLVSVQGRKAYLVPATLTKEAAVAEVCRRTGARSLLAGGDALLDAGLLAAAQRAVRPAHGELHDRGWSVPQLTVTTASGLLAGEELLGLLLGWVEAGTGAGQFRDRLTGAGRGS